MSQRVPILMYHEVTPRPVPAFRKYSVTPGELEQHVRWLARRGYRAVHLDALVDAWAGRQPLPPRAVVLTFDDGFRDCLEYAPPVLQAHGFTATFFLVAGLMGDTSRWLVRERGLELPMTTWATARSLESAGFRCEAHTVTHPRLGELAPDACRDELVRGRAMLEDGLGRAVRHLAYPFGSWSPTARAIAGEAGYLTACTTREGRATPTDDPLALPRVPVVGGAPFHDFIARLYTAYSTRQLLRATASGLRRRLLGARERA